MPCAMSASAAGRSLPSRRSPSRARRSWTRRAWWSHRGSSTCTAMPVGYAPDSNRDECFEIAKLAKKLGVPVFTHIRYLEPYGPKNSLIGHQELIALAAMTGAHMHVCHLNSTASKRIPEMLEAI